MSRQTSIWRRLSLSPSTYVGAALVLAFSFLALIGPWVAPYAPTATAQDLYNTYAEPSAAHWLGTDGAGVDLLSSMLHGARVAFLISMTVVLICSSIGTVIGTASGYFGGKVDELIMRFVDIILAFPGILLNIAVVALIAKPGVGVLIVALCANGWVSYARVARGQTLSLREQEFVHAARAMGQTPWLIIKRHIIPNLMSPIIVQMTFSFGTVILVEASLSFLGLGPNLPYTWGALLKEGASLDFALRLALVPGLAIMAVVLGANLLGDGLRDRFDPKRRGV